MWRAFNHDCSTIRFRKSRLRLFLKHIRQLCLGQFAFYTGLARGCVKVYFGHFSSLSSFPSTPGRGKATHCPLLASPRTLQLSCDDPGGCVWRARSSPRWSPRTLQLCCDDLGGFPLLPAGGCAAGVRSCRHASVSLAPRLFLFSSFVSFSPPVSFVRSFVVR